MKKWKEGYPNLALLAGFKLKGPASDKPQSVNVLQNLLTEEKDIIAKGDGKRILDQIDQIKGIKDTSAVVFTNQCYCSIKDNSSLKLEEMKEDCDTAKEYISGLKDNYYTLIFLENFLSDPEKASDLRDFYNEVQDHQDCWESSPTAQYMNSLGNKLPRESNSSPSFL